MHSGEDELKRLEEEKRNARGDAGERWRALQDMIALAESLPSVRRNTRETCLRLQAAKLARLGEEPTPFV
jgi:hypothetical protein